MERLSPSPSLHPKENMVLNNVILQKSPAQSSFTTALQTCFPQIITTAVVY